MKGKSREGGRIFTSSVEGKCTLDCAAQGHIHLGQTEGSKALVDTNGTVRVRNDHTTRHHRMQPQMRVSYDQMLVTAAQLLEPDAVTEVSSRRNINGWRW